MDCDIEVAGGLGETSGERRRIGCPGDSARRQDVTTLLTAVEGTLAAQGYDVDEPAGITMPTNRPGFGWTPPTRGGLADRRRL